MKKLLLYILLTCCLVLLNIFADTPAVEKARNRGARGKVTFRVVDSEGNPVADAGVRATFPHSDSYGDIEVHRGQTDSLGIFVAEGKSNDQLIYMVSKDGYYRTEGVYEFYRPDEDCVIKGKWQPWNPTNTVVLKEQRNPIAMYAKRVDLPIPVRDKPAGFDFEIGDWVEPFGKGKISDVYFTYKADITDMRNASLELIISAGDEMGGFVHVKKDEWSAFLSEYDATSDGYISQVVSALVRTSERILKDERIEDDEYLIFRARTVVDEDGSITKAHYGKMYGPLEFGFGKTHRVRFTYYLNPTPNDRNLEFDPKQNLFTDLKPNEEVTRP